MAHSANPPESESGQVVVMVALAALVLLVGMAAVAHWGALSLGQTRAQSVADAVALAAVSVASAQAVEAVTQNQIISGSQRLSVEVLELREQTDPQRSARRVEVEVKAGSATARAAATDS